MPDELLTEDRGAVRILRLNRPDKLNALNTALTQALLDGLEAADRDESVRAVVLTGEGRGFCAGADLSEFKDLTPEPCCRSCPSPSCRRYAALQWAAAPGWPSAAT